MKRSLLAVPLALALAVGSALTLSTSAAADPISTIAVGDHPWGVAFTPDGTKAYVANRAGGTVSVIDVASSTVIATINGFTLPMAVVANPDGSTVYVTNDDSTTGSVSVISTATNTVTGTIALAVAHAEGIAITNDGSKLYVASDPTNTVSIIATATNTVTGSFSVAGANSIALSSTGSEAWVSSTAGGIYRVDTSGPTVLLGQIPAASLPMSVHAVGSNLYFVQDNGPLVTKASLASEPGGFDAAPASVNPGATFPFALSIRSDLIGLIAFSGSGNISIYNGATNAIVETFISGSSHNGVAISPDGSVGYVTDSVSAGLVHVIRWPAIAATAAPAAHLGTSYSFSVPGTGSRTLSYAVTSGSLPAGLTLDPSTGAISGTPTGLGTSAFTVTLSSSLGSATHAYSLSVSPTLAATGSSSSVTQTAVTFGASAILLGLILLIASRQRQPGAHVQR